MKILADTREQLPYQFEKYPVEISKAALPGGDYSLPGFENTIAIERKSLADLVSCLKGSDRARFERELSRGRSYELFAVVIEASAQDAMNGKYRSDMKPNAVMHAYSG
jgi:ERCC4-type nuclease